MNKRTGLPRWRRLLAGAAAGLLAAVAHAAETTALDTYLAGMSNWSATFTQQLQDERGRELSDGSGRLIIVRPGRFRWESAAGQGQQAAQLMIADGRNLWFYDQDLEQVTVRELDEALSLSPAMLLAGGTELRAGFELTADGRRDGHDWVSVRPKQAESDFREAQFGFRGRELSRLVFINKLGQRSTLNFRDVRRNAGVDPDLVRFVPPQGVDVIGTPVAP